MMKVARLLYPLAFVILRIFKYSHVFESNVAIWLKF